MGDPGEHRNPERLQTRLHTVGSQREKRIGLQHQPQRLQHAVEPGSELMTLLAVDSGDMGVRQGPPPGTADGASTPRASRPSPRCSARACQRSLGQEGAEPSERVSNDIARTSYPRESFQGWRSERHGLERVQRGRRGRRAGSRGRRSESLRKLFGAQEVREGRAEARLQGTATDPSLPEAVQEARSHLGDPHRRGRPWSRWHSRGRSPSR